MTRLELIRLADETHAALRRMNAVRREVTGPTSVEAYEQAFALYLHCRLREEQARGAYELELLNINPKGAS